MNNGKISHFIFYDLIALSLLSVVSEVMGSGLLNVWNSDFYFSFASVIGLIAMIRWGIPGVMVAMAGGIPGIFFSEMSAVSGGVFCVLANAFLGIPILLYGKRNRDEIAGSPVMLTLYVLLSHICLSAGKGMAIFLLTGEPTGMSDYFGATFLITVINVIVCLVLRMRQGLICDMRYYFTKEEGEENEKCRN